ncbi:membrane-anchored junction protein [Cheilinus undulatus]|uniref:membrane-anchored junction protein n=1 Tax=Cheilinus undulatus TaxID=241271 RepID=UPI001BD3A5DB|nr:membrane-anchored junction protein [Cheilinus undulatus]XP_041634719.1 membrane-anchored junction protein [Cheilinus undulatus]
MPLSAFSFPVPETRILRAGSQIFKFKIRGGSSPSGEEVIGGQSFSTEFEEIVRTVLGNLDSLQPFSSTNFNVFPYKKPWEDASKTMCKQCDRNLRAHPFTLIVYLEKNMVNGRLRGGKLNLEKDTAHYPPVSEPQSKRCRRDSPLEEAIVQPFIADLEAESEGFIAGLHDDLCTREETMRDDPGQADKKGTKGSVGPQQKSGISTVGESWTPGKLHPGNKQEMIQEEEEEEESTDSVFGKPKRPGILTRLASHVFPFSLFLNDP